MSPSWKRRELRHGLGYGCLVPRQINEVMQVTSRQTNDLASAKDEVRNWRNKYHAAMGDLSSLRAMVGGLEDRIRQLMAELAAAEQAFAAAMAEKDARINGLNY